MTLRKECFKKSAIRDYKNLGLIGVVIAALCGLIYAAHYIVTTYSEAIASGEAAILGFIGGVCTAYNLLCCISIGVALFAFNMTFKAPKENETKYSDFFGMYSDIALGLIVQFIIIMGYGAIGWLSTFKSVCNGNYLSDCIFVSNGELVYPFPWISIVIIILMIIASPAAVAYARCKE